MMKLFRAKKRKLYMLVFSMLSVVMTGCQKQTDIEVKSETGQIQSQYQDHLDISIAYWLIDEAMENRNDDAVLKKIEDTFNITFVPQSINWDDYYDKTKLWAQSDSLPDIFVGAYRTENTYYQWVKEGLLHEIPEDLSAYPNLEKYMDSPEKETCQIDEKTYCIFRQTYSEQAETVKDRTILYRWDLAQKAGITQEPRNWTEFRTMIQTIIKADPDQTDIKGMTAKGYNMLIGPLFTYSMPLASSGGASFYWVAQNDRYVPAYFAGEELGEDAIATWKLARLMYQEGTIESDIALTTTSQAEEKFLQGKSAAICIDGGISNTKTFENMGRYWEEVHGKEFFEDVKALDLMPSENGEKNYTVWDYAWSETYINAKVDEQKFERILAIYDYLLSEDGILLSSFGFEGEDYTKDDRGNIVLAHKEVPSEKYASIKMLASLVCWNYGNFDSAIFPYMVPERYITEDAKRVTQARQCNIPEYDYDYTKIFYQLGSDFSIHLNSDFLTIMLEQRPVEEVWHEIIEEYKEEGLEEIIQKVNEANAKQ